MSVEPNLIPEHMRRNVLLYFGDRGRDWLACLHLLLAETADRWSLQLEPPFPNLSINYVAPATRTDGTPVVLKAGVPNKELYTEIEALRIFDGNGTVKVLESDPEQGVMLLERLMPGTSLLELDDAAEATRIAAGVMARLKAVVPIEHSFPSVGDWFAGLKRVRERFEGGSGPLPSALLDQAERLSSQLLASMGQCALLHGDLHHDNIVKSARGSWLAIDPKGVVGEPQFVVCAYLRNPMPDLLTGMNTKRVLARRVDQFSDLLGFARERMIMWGLAEAMLSASWDIDDAAHAWKDVIAIAEIYAEML